MFLDQQYLTYNNYTQLGVNWWNSERYIAGNTGYLEEIQLYLTKDSPSDDLTVSLYSNNPSTGKPNILLESHIIPRTSIPSYPTFNWIPVSFNSATLITEGESYHIIIHSSGGYYYGWGYGYTGIPSGWATLISTDYGVNWEVYTSSAFMFKTYLSSSIEHILSDSKIVSLTKFITNFATRLRINKYIQTVLNTVLNRLFTKVNTNLTTRYALSGYVKSDLRTKSVSYDSIAVKKLNNIIVKKDSSELPGVDYSTLRIQFNLNRTPSNATFKLARRHDDLDHLLDGITDSEITNKNKIQIYDDTILLFTCYITKISTDSATDTIDVTAEDIRCKINNTCLTSVDPYTDVTGSLSWGGKYGITLAASKNSDLVEISKPLYEEVNSELVEKSVGTAFLEVMSAISGLISGYESFNSGYIPEFTSQTSDCGNLIDTLVTNTANINWYTDENEYLRFQKVAQGTKKSLPLSGFNVHRHLYDVILDDITINKMTSNYYQSLVVNLGKLHTRTWVQSTTNPDVNLAPVNYVKNLTWFGFQTGTFPIASSTIRYLGEGINEIPGYMFAPGVGFYGYFVYQWLAQDSYADITPIIVGSGLPKKTIYLSGYGKMIENNHWEEIQGELARPVGSVGSYILTTPTSGVYLYNVNGENSNYLTFATDAANFELSQNNKLLSEARITMLLDAYEYYGITFKDLINISNTINSNCYVDTNGFPLNITDISIDCATRIVSLNITNYGKTYYEKIGNCMLNHSPISHQRLFEKVPAISFDPNY